MPVSDQQSEEDKDIAYDCNTAGDESEICDLKMLLIAMKKKNSFIKMFS